MLSIIENNPYRILGVYSNSSSEEQVSNTEKLLAFLKINKSFTFPLDLPHLLPPITRTEEMINEAAIKLANPEQLTKYALFWFIKKTPVDEIAFNHLIAGNVKKAKEIWIKVSTMSSLQNLFVLELICAGISQDVIKPLSDPNGWKRKRQELEDQGLFGRYADAINKYAIPIFNKGYAETLVSGLNNGCQMSRSEYMLNIINTIKENKCFVIKNDIHDLEWAKHFPDLKLPQKKREPAGDAAQKHVVAPAPPLTQDELSTIMADTIKKHSDRIPSDASMPPSSDRGTKNTEITSGKPKRNYSIAILSFVAIGLMSLLGYFVIQSRNADNKLLKEYEAMGLIALNELANKEPSSDVSKRAKARVEQICDSLYNVANAENTVEAWEKYRASVPENYLSDSDNKMWDAAFKDEETAWQYAESKKETYLYEAYLNQFPDGKHHALADKRLIDLQVSDIFAGEHGSLPAMAKTGGGGSTSRIHIKNNTSYTLTVLYSGNDSKRLVLSPQQSSNVSLPNGTYKIAASVNASNVRSFAGSENLTGGSYDVEYYISYGGTYSSYN